MAEGLLRHYGKRLFTPHSAGVTPQPVHPLAIAAMNELGIDITNQQSKSLDTMLACEYDYVIIICNQSHCRYPTFPGSPVLLEWTLADPSESVVPVEELLNQFRATRDEIHHRIRSILFGYRSAEQTNSLPEKPFARQYGEPEPYYNAS
ncbi:MAG: arsenate reductase ArsC [Chloroflexaceae bacterium]|nr:arsenate reductase ArsC [Chloroflexaceae bacterium]